MPFVYTVEEGDTLTGIALRKTGNAGNYHLLFRANRAKLKDPNTLRVGMELLVPQSFIIKEFEHHRRQAKEGEMAMSKDRVEFDLTDQESNYQAAVKASVKAFGFSQTEAAHAVRTGKRIRCRPSQFARFLIYRSEEVEVNRFSCLNAKLIPGEFEKPVIDVSDRAHRDD